MSPVGFGLAQHTWPSGRISTASATASRLIVRLAACQIVALQELLMGDNARQVSSGRSVDEVYSEAVIAVERAIALLRNGIQPPPATE
jgi:hypothetical protein